GSDLRPVVVSSRLALRLEASRHLDLGKVLRVRVVVQDRAEVLGAHVGLGSTVRFVCGLGRLAAFARVLVVEIRSEVLRAHVGLGTAPFGGPWRVAVLVVEVRSEVLRALLRTALRRRLFWLRLLGEIGGWCPHPRRFLVALLVVFGRTVRSALLLLAVAAEPGARRERSGAHAGRGRAGRRGTCSRDATWAILLAGRALLAFAAAGPARLFRSVVLASALRAAQRLGPAEFGCCLPVGWFAATEFVGRPRPVRLLGLTELAGRHGVVERAGLVVIARMPALGVGVPVVGGAAALRTEPGRLETLPSWWLLVPATPGLVVEIGALVAGLVEPVLGLVEPVVGLVEPVVGLVVRLVVAAVLGVLAGALGETTGLTGPPGSRARPPGRTTCTTRLTGNSRNPDAIHPGAGSARLTAPPGGLAGLTDAARSRRVGSSTARSAWSTRAVWSTWASAGLAETWPPVPTRAAR